MKTERHLIVREGVPEDIRISIRQRGRVIQIKTEREGVASSVLRTIVDALTKETEKPTVGFKLGD